VIDLGNRYEEIRKERIHDNQVKRCANNPKILGLDGIVLSATGVNLWTPSFAQDPNKLITQIDAMYIGEKGELYIQEHKTHKGHYGKAKRQLLTQEDFLKKYHMCIMMAMHDVNKMLYTYGNKPVVKEVKYR